MAVRRWLGRAEDVSHVVTVTVAGTWLSGETATLSIGGAACRLTVGSAVTVADVAAALAAMVNGEAALGTESRTVTGRELPQWSGVSAVATATTVVLTMRPAGVPFILTLAETSVSGTLAQATTQQATGRNWLNNPANWSGATVPVAGDTVIFDESNTSVLYGIDQITDTLLESIFTTRFLGDFGLPEQNAAGYQNYLPTYVTWRCTTVRIGVGPSGSGPVRIKFDSGAVQTSIYVTKTSSSFSDFAVQWKGTHASNLVVVDGEASFAAAVVADETAVIATLRVGRGASVYLGRGVSGLGNVQISGGEVTNDDNAIGTLVQTGGSLVVNGAAGVTDYTFVSGVCIFNSTGSIGTIVIGDGNGATLNLGDNGEAKSIGAITFKSNASLQCNRNLTISGAIALDASVMFWETR